MAKTSLPQIVPGMIVVFIHDPSRFYNANFNREKYNRLNGDEQRDYENKLWKKAHAGVYVLRDSNGTSWSLSKKEALELVKGGLLLKEEHVSAPTRV